jgi:hypothetical protein
VLVGGMRGRGAVGFVDVCGFRGGVVDCHYWWVLCLGASHYMR